MNLNMKWSEKINVINVNLSGTAILDIVMLIIAAYVLSIIMREQC